MLAGIDYIDNAYLQDRDQGHEEDDRSCLLSEGSKMLSSYSSPCVHLDAIIGRLGLLQRSLESLWTGHLVDDGDTAVG